MFDNDFFDEKTRFKKIAFFEKSTKISFFTPPSQLNHSSLSHTACSSTFDENDPRRSETFGKAFEMFNDEKFDVANINMDDYNDLVASASSDEDETEKTGKKELWKSLLQELDQEKQEDGVHKQMVFDLDSSEGEDGENGENGGNGGKDGNDENSGKIEPGMYNLDSSDAENVENGENEQGDAESESEEIDTDEELNKKAQLEMMMDGNDSEMNETDSEDEEKTEETPEINTNDVRFSALFDTNKYERLDKIYLFRVFGRLFF